MSDFCPQTIVEGMDFSQALQARYLKWTWIPSPASNSDRPPEAEDWTPDGRAAQDQGNCSA